jgi:hypothetical protein
VFVCANLLLVTYRLGFFFLTFPVRRFGGENEDDDDDDVQAIEEVVLEGSIEAFCGRCRKH